jgi:hypothetical protein
VASRVLTNRSENRVGTSCADRTPPPPKEEVTSREEGDERGSRSDYTPGLFISVLRFM